METKKLGKKEFLGGMTALANADLPGMTYDPNIGLVVSPEGFETIRMLAKAAMDLYEKEAGETRPWPYNLLTEIFSRWEYRISGPGWCVPEDMDGPLTGDQEKGLEYAFGTLSERERYCLLAYYRDGETLETIGKAMNVTRERIRQCIAKGVRKLRHPSRSRYIREGYSVVSSAVYEEEMGRHQAEINRARADAEAEIERCRRIVSGESAAEVLGESGDMETDIINLELSVRSYNVLCRHGIRTVGDFLAMSADEFIHIRNLGRKSMEEIADRLNSLGFRCFLNGDQIPKMMKY